MSSQLTSLLLRILQLTLTLTYVTLAVTDVSNFRTEQRVARTPACIGPTHMKLTIKTAHGYLSFQPDSRSDKTDQSQVRLEYRQITGPWENIDVEGFEFEPVPSVPAPADPIGPPASPSSSYVAAVKAWLTSGGVDLSGPCGALRITKVVAWGLRGSGAGLLSKPSGNNCEGYATDIVAFHDRAFDVLGDGGGANVPNWQETGVDDLSNRWRPAVHP